MRIVKLMFAVLLGVLVSSAHAADMKVGFVYVSPIGDAGWSYAHDQGMVAVEKMEGVTTS